RRLQSKYVLSSRIETLIDFPDDPFVLFPVLPHVSVELRMGGCAFLPAVPREQQTCRNVKPVVDSTDRSRCAVQSYPPARYLYLPRAHRQRTCHFSRMKTPKSTCR